MAGRGVEWFPDDKNVISLSGRYGLMKGEYNAFGYQLGLRCEYTFRDIRMEELGQFNIDRWDY